MPIAPLTQSRLAAGPGTGPTPTTQVLSLGAHLPAGVLTNADLEAMVDTSDTWIVERTGIRERRRVDAGDTVVTMGTAAAREALERARNPTLDAIIVGTCSGPTKLPAAACLIQAELGLAGMAAFDVNAACSGFVYALGIADSMIRSGAARTILVVAAEALTPLTDYADRATCVLFGDGAAAAVVGAGEGAGIRAIRWGADGRDSDLIYFGAPAGDATGPHAIRMAGKGTFRTAVERLTTTCIELCRDAGWAGDDVDWFIPHQANQRIIEAVAKRLDVPMSRVVLNIDRVGNTSAASIPLALYEAEAAGRLRPGHRILSVAFGAGVTWGGVALEWTGSR